MKIIDSARQLDFFGDIGNKDALNRARQLKEALGDSYLVLYTQDMETQLIPYHLRGRGNQIQRYTHFSLDVRLPLETLEENPSAFNNIDDGIIIEPKGQTHVSIKYDPTIYPNDPLIIGSTYEQHIGLTTGGELTTHGPRSVTANPRNFVRTLTDAINSSPKYRLLRHASAVMLPIGLALASLLFANDAEAAEDGAMEIAPVIEVTPQELEGMQDEVEAAKDTLLSLL